MTAKEALENIIKFMEDLEDKTPIPAFTKYLIEIKTIKRDLEVLSIFKKYIFIKMDDDPFMDGTYMVTLTVDDDDPWDYVHIFVSKEEKDILKEWLKDDND